MLKEIQNVTRLEGERLRRWFSDPALDLYVWYSDNDIICQFQLCYDKGPKEKAVTWEQDKSIVHHSVDDGESGIFRMKSTPILTDDAEFDLGEVKALYQNLGSKLEHDLYQFILDKLNSQLDF